MQQFHLLRAAALGLPLLHGVEAEEAGGLVEVHADPGGHGNLHDLHTLTLVPGVVTGAAPAETPGLLVLPEAAGAVAVPPSGAFVRHADHDPPGKLHLPVATEAQDAFSAENLMDDGTSGAN